jgi:hypothetical protein
VIERFLYKVNSYQHVNIFQTEDILLELKLSRKEISTEQAKMLNNNRMEDIRYPKQLDYRPIGRRRRRRPGRPLKRLLDG